MTVSVILELRGHGGPATESGCRLQSTEQSETDHRLSSPMYITRDGWIIDSVYTQLYPTNR
jgi:hypothetical protein